MDHRPVRGEADLVFAHGKAPRAQRVLEILAPGNIHHALVREGQGKHVAVRGDEGEVGVGGVLPVQLDQQGARACGVHLADGGRLGQGGQEHAGVFLHLLQILGHA
jgi:hypothetical protein